MEMVGMRLWVVVLLLPQIHKVNAAVVDANGRRFEVFGLRDNEAAMRTLSGFARILPIFDVLYPYG